MEKRYQVFVSSTFTDLFHERQEVTQALLELDCIPSGMELFPAANDDQWSLIKKAIDDCDYYLVIIAGRYGSLGPDGRSYTEMEYRYALEKGRPILAFIHKSPGSIKADYTEVTPEGKRKLAEFRALVEQKLCSYWESPAELGSKVSRSIVKAMKSSPAVGWVRGDTPLSSTSAEEILRLRKENDDLRARLSEALNSAPAGSESLAQGETSVSLAVNFVGIHEFLADDHGQGALTASWNTIFSNIAPLMINEADEQRIRRALSEWAKQALQEDYNDSNAEYVLRSAEISDHAFHTVIVQLRALGLITMSTKNRGVKNTHTHWKLTPLGDRLMTRLLALPNTAATLENHE
ncbi:MAG: DUF4062 domain-containing protein [Planctomycetota bacterium]